MLPYHQSFISFILSLSTTYDIETPPVCPCLKIVLKKSARVGGMEAVF